jgi:hypothetical protein
MVVNGVVFEHQSWIVDLWGDSVVGGVLECSATMARVADVLRTNPAKCVSFDRQFLLAGVRGPVTLHCGRFSRTRSIFLNSIFTSYALSPQDSVLLF